MGPWELMFPEKPFWQKMDQTYSHLIFGYFILLIVTQYMEVYMIVASKFDINALVASLGFTLNPSVDFLRMLTTRFNPDYFKLLNWVMEKKFSDIRTVLNLKLIISATSNTATKSNKNLTIFLFIF